MFGKVFGANVDWISQHSVLPEYFRQQFYDTGQLFPEFAANIGGGQNIYNFSYYGLYSPLILPSYFLPFFKMSDYMIAVSLLCLLADVLLFFKWLRQNDVSKGNACLTSLLFLLSGPLIFHSYNQTMFVNYMPFLLLGLLGVDRYFYRKKSGLFTVSVFLMIMTSFYFSIGGILVLILYGIYRYLTVQASPADRTLPQSQAYSSQKVTCRSFLPDGIKFCLPILSAVLMSGFLLVPTALTLIQGTRSQGTQTEETALSFASLFLPDSDLLRVLYHPYGIGLTTLVITVLLTGLTYRTWREKYIHIVCILVISIPFFLYILNGGLYIRGKVLIPMIPLLCYLTAIYLEKQRHLEIPFFQGVVPYVITLGIVSFGQLNENKQSLRCFLIADAIVMLLCALFFYWKHIEKLIVIIPIGFLILFGTVYQIRADHMLDAAFYHQVTDKNIKKTAEQVLDSENGFYRTEQLGTDTENAANLNRIWSTDQYSSSLYSSAYNKDYQNFRQNIFGVDQPYRNLLMQAQAKNPFFQNLMGVKYVLSAEPVAGYEKVTAYNAEKNAVSIYENKEALPIVYTTRRTISQKEYEKLPFPYNQTAFLSYAVTKNDSDVTAEDLIQEQAAHVQTLALPLEPKIQTKKNIRKNISIPQAQDGDILFLQFRVKNLKPSRDVSVWVEGIRNKLTSEEHIYYNENELFTYAVPLQEEQDSIQIVWGGGSYKISDLQSYMWHPGNNTDEIGREILCEGEFSPDEEKTKGNVIAGTINTERSGYLITSIPYDKSFEVYIDGQLIENEKVNTAFLGVSLDRVSSEKVSSETIAPEPTPSENETHDIRIVYHAPGLKIGKILSVLGILLWIGISRSRRVTFSRA